LLSIGPPQILARIGWLLLTLLVSFLGALAGLRAIELRGLREIVADETEEHGRLLDNTLLQASRPLRLFTESYSRRTTYTRPNEMRRGASAESSLRTGLRTFELQAAWVVEADGSLRFHEAAADEAVPALELPPMTPAQIAALTTSRTSFYMERGGLLYRVRGARLAPDSTHRDAPRGWMFAALRLDVNALSPFVEGRASLVLPGEAGQPPAAEYLVRIERVLRDFANQPLRVLRLECRPPEIDVVVSTGWLDIFVVAAFGVVMLGVLGFCLVRWVILPAGTMRRSLALRDPGALSPLLARGGYVGELAELVRQVMETQFKLERTLAERARLGRELHDGVIQTIYAAGMGLAGVRLSLRDKPAEAERVIEDTRAVLNATIVDLRGFIKGIETEELSQRKFSDAVQAVTGLIQSIRSVHFNLEIDDACVESFPAATRMQLLQIVREAVSNAVRHGGASCVTVSFQREPAGAVLEVRDNGTGFDPAGARSTGHGLANFQVRARELGGTISIASGAGRGTQVKLVLPEQI
jgi:signal transduction histidine kinase